MVPEELTPPRSPGAHAGPVERRAAWLPPVAAAAAFLSVGVPLCVAAWQALPVWDDGWLWLLFREHGAEAIVPSLPDRRVNASLWSLFAGTERGFWRAALGLSAVAWTCLAGIGALLWRRAFPDLSRHAVLVACVVVAPLLSPLQLVPANVSLMAVTASVLAWTSILLALRFVDGARAAAPGLAAGIVLVFAGVQLNEYAISAFLSGLFLLGLHGIARGGPTSRAALAGGSLLVATGASYALYLSLLGDSRADVLPGHSASVIGEALPLLPFRLLASLWTGLVAGPARAFADPGFFGSGRIPAVAALYGGLTAALLVAAAWRPGLPSPARSASDRIAFLALLAALVVGLAPAILMGRRPWADGMESRFGIPVLPVAAAVLVRAALAASRRRSWAVPVLALGFAAGSLALQDAWSAVRERRAMASVGEMLRPRVEATDGFSVAILSLPERSMGPRLEWELVARITERWPAQLRERFWAYDAAHTHRVEALLGARTRCREAPGIDVEIRLVERRGPLTAAWLVTPARHPSATEVLERRVPVEVEPWCIRGGAGIP